MVLSWFGHVIELCMDAAYLIIIKAFLKVPLQAMGHEPGDTIIGFSGENRQESAFHLRHGSFGTCVQFTADF